MATSADSTLTPAERRAVERAAEGDDELAAVVRAFFDADED